MGSYSGEISYLGGTWQMWFILKYFNFELNFEHSVEFEIIKAAATDMRYFASSEFSSLVYKKNFSLL